MASFLGIITKVVVLILVLGVVGGIVALVVYLSSRSKADAQEPEAEEGKSYFDGGYLAYVGYSLLVGFVTAITFGIAFPWMCCLFQKWLAKHTVICGKRMYFDGTGVQLIGRFLLWSFLTLITFGIYGFWMALAIKKWVSKHTHFIGEEDNNSYFDGGILGFIGTNILASLVLAIPFVGLAWSNIIKLKWEKKHTVTDSRRLVFVGTVGNFFLKYLLWGFLTVITFGIFGLFVPVKNLRLEAENTIDHEHTPEALLQQSEYRNIIRTDSSSFKSYNVEYEMEGIKAGITDNTAEGDLLVMANGGSRAAQYLYATRYAKGNYTEEPYSSLLKASAEAEYAPAMCLYALTHDTESVEEMLTKAAEKGQIAAIRNRLFHDGELGISVKQDKSALPHLKNAVRYGDLLQESGEELTDEEQALLKKCILAIRRIESAVTVSSNAGKAELIAVAVLVAISVILGLIGSLALFRAQGSERPAQNRPVQEQTMAAGF